MLTSVRLLCLSAKEVLLSASVNCGWLHKKHQHPDFKLLLCLVIEWKKVIPHDSREILPYTSECLSTLALPLELNWVRMTLCYSCSQVWTVATRCRILKQVGRVFDANPWTFLIKRDWLIWNFQVFQAYFVKDCNN